jgi:hypothetical protein
MPATRGRIALRLLFRGCRPLASYEQIALGYLAVLRMEDGTLIGRRGLMDLVVESAAPEHGIRRGLFGREEAPAGVVAAGETRLQPVSAK